MEAIGDSADLSRLVVYASDFTRARETAEEAHGALRSLAGSETLVSPKRMTTTRAPECDVECF